MGRVLIWTVLLAAVGLITVMVVVPRLGGATPYTVLTGSMRPAYPPNTLMVMKPVEAEDIAVGDVITYQVKSNEPAVITHRVVGMGYDPKTGEPIFRTQGDANPGPDEGWVRVVQVRGELWYSLPWVGRMNTWLSGDQRMWGIWGVSALLIGYAAWAFGGSLLDRVERRRRRHDRPSDGPRAPDPSDSSDLIEPAESSQPATSTDPTRHPDPAGRHRGEPEDGRATFVTARSGEG